MMRTECQGCQFEGKAILCAVLDLKWAWYELLKTIPLLDRVAQEPEPCWMKEDAE